MQIEYVNSSDQLLTLHAAQEVESTSLRDNKSSISKEISPFDEGKEIIFPIPNLDMQANSPVSMGIQATNGLEEATSSLSKISPK